MNLSGMIARAIFPGTYFIQSGSQTLLAGCPPEIIKVLLQKKLPAPGVVLLPDVPVRHGESQVAVEFPLYHHLFIGPDSSLEKPLVLAGSGRRVESARELLRLCLYGPDLTQMEAWTGWDRESADRYLAELEYFQLKNKDGRKLTIEDLTDLRPAAGDGFIRLDWLEIQCLGNNRFRLRETSPPPGGEEELPVGLSAEEAEHTRVGPELEIDLNFEEAQVPPYPVHVDLNTTQLVKLGVEVLGGSTGFSATQASSGMALCYNGNYLLIDAIPYLNHHLRARGIARNQVHSLFLSHIHDDHCNLISLLQYNRKIKVLTTRLIFRMMLEKLSLNLDRPVDQLENYFEFTELIPGETTNFYGLKITPYRAIHSIPTLGARFEVSHSGKSHKIIFTGDTQARRDIEAMRVAGVLSEERALEVQRPYQEEGSLLLADGGEGMIHGEPEDALESPADRVVFLHLDKISDEFAAHFSVTSSGKRFTILEGNTNYWVTRTIEFLLDYFPDMPPTWISNLLGDLEIRRFNAGDIILRQGSRSQGFLFMVLTGYARVISHEAASKTELAQMEAGELIGEMAVLSGGGQRNASVVAYSPVSVAAISETTFLDFVQHQNLMGKLNRLWGARQRLQRIPEVGFLSQPVLRRLAAVCREEVLPGGEVARQLPLEFAGGLLFFDGLVPDWQLGESGARPVDGLVSGDSRILRFSGGGAVGYRTGEDVSFLFLPPEEMVELVADVPLFRFFLEEELKL